MHATLLRLRPLALIAALASLVLLAAAADAGQQQKLRVSTSGDNSERIKTVAIGKRPGSKSKVAMSISPNKVGPVRPGDAIVASGDIEVSTTCLEPMPQCVGKRYSYSPFVRARLVLGAKPTARSPKSTYPLSRWDKIKCAQDLPNRNHHCVLVIPRAQQAIPNDAKLPCTRCNVNLVLDAYSGQAKKGNVLVVGTDEDSGIAQDKGRISAAVFKPGPVAKGKLAKTTRPSTGRLPVSGSSKKKTVLYSLRLGNLKAGEQFIVDSKATVSLAGKPYNALLQSQLVLSEKPGSVSRSGNPTKVTKTKGQISDINGFNCTRGSSAHRSPCAIRRPGIMSLVYDSKTNPVQGTGADVPLYLNLVASAKGQFGKDPKPGDALRIGRKSGFIKAYRYGPEFK
ncbi:hypothetical protein HJD18_15140 [Thermoleophilia bacterium SCSIO 60948]|nr:hypothetical protein HJD18_15140 [Thermoleophilia bacterium SCSIO 60948]